MTHPADLVEAAEQVLRNLDRDTPYAIHKLGDPLIGAIPPPSTAEVLLALDARKFDLTTNKILHTTYGSVVGYQTNLSWQTEKWGIITPLTHPIELEARRALSQFHVRAAVKHLACMPENSTVEIEKDESVSEESLIKKLSKLGYPPAGTSNFVQKAKSYVSCAIGRLDK